MEQPSSVFRPPSAAELRRLHPERPLQWQDYAEAWLSFPLGRVLDYGCGTGGFLERLGGRCAERWGVDVDTDRVAVSPGAKVQFRRIEPDGPLPFDEESFDTVILMEVIEHVADERRVMQEAARVLKPRGRLLLTTPHAGLLTFLDPGNVKFVAPRLHRFIHCTLLRRGDYYLRRFGTGRQRGRGMLADFTLDQDPWHRHYSYGQVRAMAPEALRTLAWAVYYPAFRALWSLRLALKVLTRGRWKELPRPLQRWNDRLSRRTSRGGDQLVILFEKRS